MDKNRNQARVILLTEAIGCSFVHERWTRGGHNPVASVSDFRPILISTDDILCARPAGLVTEITRKSQDYCPLLVTESCEEIAAKLSL